MQNKEKQNNQINSQNIISNNLLPVIRKNSKLNENYFLKIIKRNVFGISLNKKNEIILYKTSNSSLYIPVFKFKIESNEIELFQIFNIYSIIDKYNYKKRFYNLLEYLYNKYIIKIIKEKIKF